MHDSDYEHWPEEATSSSSSEEEDEEENSPIASPGYDSHNGLRTHTYYHADSGKADKKKAAAPAPELRQPAATYAYPHPVQYAPYVPGYPWGYAPQMMYSAPGFYGYMGYGPEAAPMYQPPGVAAPEEKKKSKKKSTQPAKKKKRVKSPSPSHRWQGRSGAEIERDDMRMAAREGAYDKRKMVPVGLEPDQMVWCVELDGDRTLRTYATVKDFKGDWKADPRFEDAWYFVRKA